jgi:hypothetical protein
LKLFARIGERRRRRRRKVQKRSDHILDLSHPGHVCLHLFFFCWVLCKRFAVLSGVMSLSRRDEVSVFIKKDLKIKNK